MAGTRTCKERRKHKDKEYKAGPARMRTARNCWMQMHRIRANSHASPKACANVALARAARASGAVGRAIRTWRPPSEERDENREGG
eukprot:2520349-Alexandrium_andersonii.AAC.1